MRSAWYAVFPHASSGSASAGRASAFRGTAASASATRDESRACGADTRSGEQCGTTVLRDSSSASVAEVSLRWRWRGLTLPEALAVRSPIVKVNFKKLQSDRDEAYTYEKIDQLLQQFLHHARMIFSSRNLNYLANRVY